MEPPQPVVPGPGQESVWDYPRPPRAEPTTERIRVIHAGYVVVDTTSAWRILETSQPPGYYVPRTAVDATVLRPSGHHTFCEWKGTASYVDLAVPGAAVIADAAWWYPTPSPAYAAIAGHLAFYPQKVDACFVDDEQVDANDGSFYGGWITSKIVGPFKGGAGTWGW
jgi:uncharacterized protein (DUF427 family)